MFESLDASMPMGMMSEAVVSATAPVDRQLAKSASLDLRAQSLEWTVGKIQEIAKNVGGYTESANVSEPKLGAKSAWLTIRVPADRLDATLDEVKQSAAAVVNEQLNIGDVTDQDIDLSARLSTKLAEEAALVSILEKVAKVSDIIEVTDRLAMVRGEIERMQAQQRLLKGQVTMAIVSISITEDPRVVTDAGQMRDGNVLKQSLSDLYRFGIALGSAIIILVVNGLPMLFVFGFFFWLSYRLARFAANRIMRKKK
jgi:predicted house-cleaning noncanonical NTP pyrophosphatase (MazG superfamily)